MRLENQETIERRMSLQETERDVRAFWGEEPRENAPEWDVDQATKLFSADKSIRCDSIAFHRRSSSANTNLTIR